MRTRRPARERAGPSLIVVRAELLAANTFAWIASARGDELSSDTHLYLFERYLRLADHHRRHGRVRRAARLQRKADDHLWYVDGGDPPRAAAMAMPRPRPWIVTDAVSRVRLPRR